MEIKNMIINGVDIKVAVLDKKNLEGSDQYGYINVYETCYAQNRLFSRLYTCEYSGPQDVIEYDEDTEESYMTEKSTFKNVPDSEMIEILCDYVVIPDIDILLKQ